MTGNTTNDRGHGEDLRIAHFFGDVGVESEALSAFGDVHRYSIDPDPSPFNACVTEIDLAESEPDVEDPFDLGFFQPPCYKWTQRTAEDGPNYIPRARELAERYCREYIIENKPDAPLRAPPGGDRVELHGSMFGLPVAYERAFEVSYEVDPPRRDRRWTREHRVENTRPKQYWKAVKGYTGDYPAQDLITNAVPSRYVYTLVRPMLDGFDGLTTSQATLEDTAAVRCDGGTSESERDFDGKEDNK